MNFDLIAITESWLSGKDNIDMFSIPYYNIEFINREYNKGGGVLLYIRDELSYNVIENQSFSKEGYMDILTVEIKLNTCKGKKIFTISCVYKSPCINLRTFLPKFEEFIESHKGQHSYIIGDLNINILKHSASKEVNNFIDLMLMNSFNPLINQPTRFSKSSNTLIDNIWTNDNKTHENLYSYIIYSDISDHLPIALIVRDSKVSTPKTQIKSTIRDLKKSNIDKINAELSKCKWYDVLRENDAEKSYNIFHDYLQAIICKHCPMKQVTHIKPKNWVSNKLKNACRKKDKLYKKFLNKPTQINENIYKRFRNRLTQSLRNSERSYYRQKLTATNNCPKETWKTINHVLHKNAKYCHIKNLKYEGHVISDNDKICEILNKHFTAVGSSLAKKIPTIQGKRHLDYLKNKNTKSLFLNPTCDIEITDIVNGFKNKKSSGHDEINILTLKQLLPNILKPLVHIVNISLSTGVFPSKLKVAKIIPIFKSGNKQDVNNYRPISLLTTISKIFEKIYYNRLIKFLDKNSAIVNNQYGFRKKSNTSIAIIDMVENILESLHENKIPVGVFIDLKKAFDCIDHSILMDKLSHYGVRGVALKWIKSYLADRQQFVSCKESMSSKLNISTGVPQGSILGPLLFIIYINDIINISNKLKFFLYADDTNILFTEESPLNLKTKLELELIKLLTWLDVNKLSINLAKTSYIIFGNYNIKDLELTMLNTAIRMIESTKFLGIIIDSKLTWKDHITYVENKLVRSIRTINLIKHKLDKGSLIKIYNSIILPHLMYCSEIWGNTNASSLLKLKRLQNKCIRIIERLSVRSSVSNHYKLNKLLKLKDLIFYKLCMLGYQAYNASLPNSMHHYFIKKYTVHNYHTRTNHHFTLSNKNCKYSKKSVVYNIKNTFNKIPDVIKNKYSLHTFKTAIKKYILNQY
jgi:hypothetical protein